MQRTRKPMIRTLLNGPFARSFPFGMQSILRTPKPFCGRPKCPFARPFWRTVYSRGTPLSGLVWIDAGAFCLAGVAFHDIGVLSCGRRCTEWHGWCFRAAFNGKDAGKWPDFIWFWYLIHNDLPSKSLNHHSSSLCCLLSHLSLHFSTALNPFFPKKKRLWRRKSNYNRPAAFVESGPPFFVIDSVCFVVRLTNCFCWE